MSTPLSSIRNVGPALEHAFRAAGIETAEQLRDLGPEAAYSKIVEAGTRPHFIGYYALVMGLQARPWNDCQGKEKDKLRERFDALVAKTKPVERSDLAADLDTLGVRL